MGQWSNSQSRYSLASAEVDVAGNNGGGATLRGIQEITLTDEVDVEAMYGNGPHPIGAPVGTWKGSGSLTTIPEEADLLCQGLGNGWSTRNANLGITLSEPDGADPITWNVAGIRFKKREAKFGKAGGSDPALETLDFLILEPIDWNGIQSIESRGPSVITGLIGEVLSLL